MLKKILYILIINFTYVNAFWFYESELDPMELNPIINVSKSDPLNPIFEFVKDSIFWLMWLISIWVFIFIWTRLVVARWNPEEFKKALMQLVYAVIGLFVIAVARLAVKLISWLNF